MKELSISSNRNNLPERQNEANLNFNPSELPWVGCEKGIQIYESGYIFKKLSALLSPTGKEELIPAEVLICKQCGKVPSFISDKIIDFPNEYKSSCK